MSRTDCYNAMGITKDEYICIKTTITREAGFRSMLKFEVTASVEHYDELTLKDKPEAKLSGFMTNFDFEDPDRYYAHFDSQSAHAEDTFGILCKKQKAIASALGLRSASNIVDYFDSVALIERIYVPSEWRGHKLALRLLREAQSVLSRSGLLVVARAYPGEVQLDKKGRDLADYYRSEPLADFHMLNARASQPWLVAHWHTAEFNDLDDSIWDPSAHLKSAPLLEAQDDALDLAFN